MNENTLARVRYFDQQFLRLQDFTDEQAYHLAIHRRHLISGHSWGILYGLDMEKNPEGELIIQPGLASDGYGRELMLPEYYPISRDVFFEKGSDTLDVWLEYDRQELAAPKNGSASCQPGGGDTAGRFGERPRVVFSLADPDRTLEQGINLPEDRKPSAVDPNDLPFPPTRLAPDDPGKRWPIFLGQIHRTPGNPDEYAIDLRGRPYAGLVGELVQAPSGFAWLQMGEWENNNYRFGVFLNPDQETPDSQVENEIEPRLGILKDGEIELRGDTTVFGDLIVDGGAVEFGVGPAYAAPRPWRMYLAESEIPTDEDQPPELLNQLRLEMAGPGVKTECPGRQEPTGTVSNEVVVGHWSDEAGKFVPCLTVAEDCTVTVSGDLVVKGELEFLALKKNPVNINLLTDKKETLMALESITMAKGYYRGLLTEFELGKFTQGSLEVFLQWLAQPHLVREYADFIVGEMKKEPQLINVLKGLLSKAENEQTVDTHILGGEPDMGEDHIEESTPSDKLPYEGTEHERAEDESATDGEIHTSPRRARKSPRKGSQPGKGEAADEGKT